MSTETAVHEVESFSFLGMSWKKVMMWIFIVTDALLFAGYLASYGYTRIGAGTWPDQRAVFHLWFISLMTFVLITSSATMATAVAAARARDEQTVRKMVLATALGGSVFLGMQAFEWTTLIREGVTLTQNAWNIPSFGNYFFLITGFHGTHVLIGVIVLFAVARKAYKGAASEEGVEMAGLYWHFVDLVWVFIFTLFYLI